MNIALLGNTGSGKTTFAKQLVNNFENEHKYLYDNKYGMIKDSYSHQYMEEFYKDPYNYAFRNELIFLLKSIENIAFINYGRKDDHIILDRSFLDIYVFVEAMKKVGMLEDCNDEGCLCNGNDYKILKKYVDTTFDLYLDNIDLIVYMRTDFNLLHKNIASRARKAETSITHVDEFTKLALQMNEEMDDLIKKLKKKGKKILYFENLSSNDIKSDIYQNALKLVDGIASHME